MSTETTAQGARRLRGKRQPSATTFLTVVPRTVTVDRALDAKVVARMDSNRLSYSAVVAQALRILFDEGVAS